LAGRVRAGARARQYAEGCRDDPAAAAASVPRVRHHGKARRPRKQILGTSSKPKFAGERHENPACRSPASASGWYPAGAPRSRLLQTSTLGGAPGTAKARVRRRPATGRIWTLCRLCRRPAKEHDHRGEKRLHETSTLGICQRLVGTTPQRSASSATAHRQRAICFATQCLHWLVPAAIPRGHPSQRVVGDQGVLAGGLGDLSYFNRSFRRRFGATPSRAAPRPSPGLSIDCPRSTSS